MHWCKLNSNYLPKGWFPFNFHLSRLFPFLYHISARSSLIKTFSFESLYNDNIHIVHSFPSLEILPPISLPDDPSLDLTVKLHSKSSGSIPTLLSAIAIKSLIKPTHRRLSRKCRHFFHRIYRRFVHKVRSSTPFRNKKKYRKCCYDRVFFNLSNSSPDRDALYVALATCSPQDVRDYLDVRAPRELAIDVETLMSCASFITAKHSLDSFSLSSPGLSPNILPVPVLPCTPSIQSSVSDHPDNFFRNSTFGSQSWSSNLTQKFNPLTNISNKLHRLLKFRWFPRSKLVKGWISKYHDF